MNFSVVMICKNEVKSLPRMFASLEEFKARGGETVILDTGSTDGTIEYALKWGARVIDVGDKHIIEIGQSLADAINNHFMVDGEKPVIKAGDKIFDFAAARNNAASHASHDMCSTPDCDEAFVTLNLDAVEQVIKNGFDQLEFNFVFAYDAFGNEAVKFLQCKFYDRRKLHWEGVVHEVLQHSPSQPEPRRHFLDESIFKIGHWQNHTTDRSGYLKGLAYDCYIHPEKDRNSHYFGRELMWAGRPKSAIKELERHVGMKQWLFERSHSIIYIGNCYKQLGQNDKAVESYHRAYDVEAGRREPFLKLSEHYAGLGDWQRVACYATAALQIPWSNYYANDMSDYTHRPHQLLAEALFHLGRKEESNIHHAKALEFLPLDGKLLHDYRFHNPVPTVDIILPTLGRPEGLQACMDSIARLNYPQELIKIWKDDREGPTVPQKMAEGVANTSGDVICYAANDMTFEHNSLILAVIAMGDPRMLPYTQRYGLVAFNGGPVSPDEGNICEHFIVRRSFLPQLENGQVFSTDFHHAGCDNWLWAQAKRLGQAVRCEHAKIEHSHFTRGAEFDEVYKLGWSKVEQDRVVLANKLEQLADEQERYRAFMDPENKVSNPPYKRELLSAESMFAEGEKG